VADALTLASAQLAVAREYGFASRTRLRDEGTARMLAATPELAGYGFATAVILDDAGRVWTELGRDPGLCTRVFVWTRAKGATGRSAY
jgi:hypothetical protein